MAVDPNQPNVAPPNQIDAMLDREAPLDPSAAPAPAPIQRSYQVFPDSKIAVSKKLGVVVKARKDAGRRALEMFVQAWNEAVKYYNNDQFIHRTSPSDDRPGNTDASREVTDEFSETENLVFANVNAMMPSLYAKNPTVEFTGPAQFEELLDVVEKLMKTLMQRKAMPGINLKPKARRHVLRALLMNMSYIEIGFNKRVGSPESAQAELAALTEQLAAADEKTIREIEGKLQAIETETSVLFPPGPWMRIVDPRLVIRDSEAEEEDLSDSNYLLVGEYMPTEWLKARFTDKLEDRGIVLKFEPTHVVAIGGTTTSGVEDEVNNFTLLSRGLGDQAYKKYGFDDELAFRTQCRTLVWKYYDKSTRRVMWWLENDWAWPLWVWDDPNQLAEFFPVYPLGFHQNPEAPLANGEVSYYLDQQDAVNTINSARNKELMDVHTKYFHNADIVSEDTMEKFLSSKRRQSLAITGLPEGSKLEDFIWSPSPKSVQYQALFDKNPLYAAIDRISSTNDVMRGGQFKTNTTNDAIETYNSAASGRNEEKIDQIEDCLSHAIWGIAQLCLMNMSADQVSVLIGEDVTATWRNLTPDELRNGFSPQVVAGSTTKPTSALKKAQAMEAGQVLGQFAGSNPNTASIMTSIVLRMFSRAFDEIVISKDEWNMLIQATEAGGPLGMIDQLDPQLKMAFVSALMKGVPAQQALDLITQAAGKTSGGASPEGPPASTSK